MKKTTFALRAAAALFAFGFAASVRAATPVAVWDGASQNNKFTSADATTQNGWTIDVSGCTDVNGDGSVVRINTAPISITNATATANSAYVTVVLELANVPMNTSSAVATFGRPPVGGYVDTDLVGLMLENGQTYNIWNGVKWSTAPATSAAYDPAGVNRLAVCFKAGQNNGIEAYQGSTQINRAAQGLKATMQVNTINIGGVSSNNSLLLSGADVSKIAIFVDSSSPNLATICSTCVFPSEEVQIQVSSDTTVSALNGQIGGAVKADLDVTDGVTITIDEAFSANSVKIASAGSVTLSASSQPDAATLAPIDVSEVQGSVFRSWLTPGVVGANFNSPSKTVTSSARVAGGTWLQLADAASGSNTGLFSDGLSKLTWSSSNTYSYDGNSFLCGYLDDGANGGNGATVTLTGVPYATYDVVIYASTDTESVQFLAKTVNGKTYTWDSATESVVEGNSVWGASRVARAAYGTNALRITGLSGALTIYGNVNNGNRGGIAAVQIVPPGTPDVSASAYTLALDGTDANWSSASWQLEGASASAPTAGEVEITLSASTTLTIDSATAAAIDTMKVMGAVNAVLTLVVQNGATFSVGEVTVAGGVLKQGSASVLGAASVAVRSGGTYDVNGLAINGSANLTIAGAGAGDWPWALTSSGGESGTILKLNLSGDAAIGGVNKIRLGASGAGYNLNLNGHTLTKTGAGALECFNVNTPGTGTICLTGGEMSVNQWNNLNSSSGNTTLVLREGASFRQNSGSHLIAVNTLEWTGGTLNTANRLRVNSAFYGSGETQRLVFNSGATLTLDGNLTLTTDFTGSGALTFSRDASVQDDVTVSLPATVSSAQGTTWTVNDGVILNLGTARPAATISVAQGGTLAIRKTDAFDIPQVKVAALPESVVLYDENGSVVPAPKIVYDAETGMITVFAGNAWTAEDGFSFDNPSNWSAGAAPSSGDSATVFVSGNTEISVSDTYQLASLVISGEGEVTFAGEGSVTAATLALENGARFRRGGSSALSAIAYSLASGTTLVLDSVTEASAISGAGAVETYGNVTFSAANSFTGGLTVKTGTASTTTGKGFASYDGDISPARRITVENGACLDIANTKDFCHALVIAGKGVFDETTGEYSGAVKNGSSTAMGYGARQTMSITLTADATVDVSTGWGIVNAAHGAAVLALNGHTLTMRGSGTVPMVNINTANGAATTGTLVLDGANLHLAAAASNLAGVDIVVRRSSAIDLESAPTAVGSLAFEPAATGTTAAHWNLPAGFVPKIRSGGIDAAGLSAGDELTLLTVPSGVSLENGAVAFELATSRYTGSAVGNTAKATVKGLANFMHYDFNAENSVASDSTYNFGLLNPTFLPGKNGSAGLFKTDYTPWYDTNTSGKSPIHSGEMTVTALVKCGETGNKVIWNTGAAGGDGIALVALDSQTFALTDWVGGGAVRTVASVTGVPKVVGSWHFVAVTVNANGTKLYVDNLPAASGESVSTAMTQVGQFGSVHGGNKSFTALGAEGFRLDDWTVYDTALSAEEIRALKNTLSPASFSISVR